MDANTKKRVFFCALKSPEGEGVVDYFSLADTLAYHYLAAYALKDEKIIKNYEFHIRESFSEEQLIKTVAEEKPSLIGFTCYLRNIQRNLSAARRMKETLPDSVIILGGPEVVKSQRTLEKNPFVDIVVRGEGEEIFRQILTELESPSPALQNINGISFRRNGQIITTPDAALLRNLADIPPIYNQSLLPSLSNIVLYETSRGCYFRCKFCTWTSRKRRFYPLNRVEDDLKLLLSSPKIKRIYFIDSDFGEEKERAVAILNMIKKYNRYNTEFSSFLTLRNIDEEMLQLCAELNFPAEVPYGLQSVNRKALDAVGRRWFKLEALEEKLQLVLKYIPRSVFVIDVIYGLPNDNHEGFKQTIRWCLDWGFSRLNFFRLGGYPGTEFATKPERYGLVFDPEPPYLVRHSNTYTEEDIARTETFLTNLQVMMSFLNPEDYQALKKCGVDMIELAETAHRSTPNWNKYFTKINESNISDIDRSVGEHIIRYLRTLNLQEGQIKEAEKIISAKIR
ncbi:MAG: radical SAM protein [bacterium]